MKCDICNLEKENRVLTFNNREILILPCREYIDDKTHKYTIAIKKVKHICSNCLFEVTHPIEEMLIKKGYTGPFDKESGFDAFTFK